MKRAALFTLTLFLVTIFYSSCKEDVYMDWKIQNDQWFARFADSVKNDTSYHKTSTGLIYKVLIPGWKENRMPDKNSYISADFTGRLIDNSIIDSGKDTLSYSISNFVPGLQEGLKKMHDGGTCIFYIPSSLGADTASTSLSVAPHSVLIYEIKLVESYGVTLN